jgi:hypothetical protein
MNKDTFMVFQRFGYEITSLVEKKLNRLTGHIFDVYTEIRLHRYLVILGKFSPRAAAYYTRNV